MKAKPPPSPEEQARAHAAMLAWIREQRRKGYRWVSVSCLGAWRANSAHSNERTAA